MFMRRISALMILTILTGCGQEPQTPARETGSTSKSVAAPAEQKPADAEPEVPPDESGLTTEEPVEATVEVKQVTEADLADDSPSPPVVVPSDQPETSRSEPDDVEQPSTEVVEDSAVVAPPVEAPPASEGDDGSAAAVPQAEEDQPQQVPASADPIVALLDELEQSAADLRTFTAEVLYQTEDALLGQKVARKGAIAYAVDAETKHKKFSIRFTEIIESGRMRQRNKYYIFNDRWLVEVDEAEKTFIKREIVPPGSTFDPLKLGEGPFPLPIGQAREEVLARFEVELIELPQDGSLAALREKVQVHGLRLKPKATAPEAEDYDHIDLFYDKESLLPAGVEVIEANGDRKTARLDNLRRNPGLEDDFSVAEPDPTVWRIDVRPWQERP